MSVAHGAPTKLIPASFIALGAKIKKSLTDFDKDEEGMNTVEVIILLFVAAVILIAFFTLIWPKIKDAVINKLEELFGTSG